MHHAAWIGSILLTLTVGLSGIPSDTGAASSGTPTRMSPGLPPAAAPIPASFAGAPPAMVSGADGTWYPVPTQPPPSPPIGPRFGLTIVFDTLHQRFVAFGSFSNEVWSHEISGTAPWVLESVAGTPPSPRWLHSAVYDPTLHRMLVFGGNTDGSGTNVNDLWQLDFTTTPPTWSQVAATGTPPSPRSAHTAVFDPVRRRMVVFGGYPSASNETWLLDCTTSPPNWQLAPVNGPIPGARSHHCAVYDPDQDQMVIFGGYAPAPQYGFGDIWTLSMSTLSWTLRGTADPGMQSAGMSAAYQPLGHRMFVTNVGLWSLDLDTYAWTQWGWEPGDNRDLAGFALDPSGHHGLLHGGLGWDVAPDDTWLLTVDHDAPVWSWGQPIASRNGAAGVYDPLRDRFLMIGGAWVAEYRQRTFGDISELQIGRDSSWVQVVPVAPFGRRVGAGAVYDPVRDRVVVFGGYNNNGTLNDTWLIGLSPSMTVTPAAVTGVPPPGRGYFAAIYDPVRDRIVIYGGTNQLGDIWALNLSPSMSWSPITPAPGPAPLPRMLHKGVYDPYGDRMLVFGGAGGGHTHNDLWALSLGATPTWTQLAPAGTLPAPRSRYSLEYDPNRQRAILFGGVPGIGAQLNDVWELKLGGASLAWNLLSPGGPSPTPRYDQFCAYDPIHDRMLVCGGVYFSFGTLQDIWRLQFASDLPTATAIALLSSDAQSDEVILKWGLSGDAATWARLERRDATSDWRTIESGPASGSFVTFHDRSVVAGARHAYRLTVSGSGGTSTSAEVWIDVPSGPVFSLAGFSPNPATQEARVEFSLYDRTPATIEVVDVGGRRMAARHIESPVPGRQTIAITPAGGIAPGLYFVKLTQGSRTLVARGIVVR